MTKKQRQKRNKEIVLLLSIMIGAAIIGIFGQLAEKEAEASIIPELNVNRRQEADSGVKQPLEAIDVSEGVIREVTAYNVGDPAQTDDSPCIGASGQDLCKLVDQGVKVCAANFVPLGSKLYVQNVGECLVLDKMAEKHPNRVDVAMKTAEKQRALKFGLQRLEVVEF